MSLYSLFREDAARGKGGYRYPEMDYIRRVYAGLIKDVKLYYRKAPKAVESKNILANLLLHIPIRIDYDDHNFLRYAEDVGGKVARAFGLTNASVVGKVHEGLTLGPQTQEVLLITSDDFPLGDMKARWRDLSPLTYLYHTRTDVNLPIMNNTTPGKGYGVAVLNLPMMALMYRYWLKEQATINREQSETVNRFIGGYVLPNAVTSYLDIAFFNRLSRAANKIGTPNFPTAHPFYITDMTGRLDRVISSVLNNTGTYYDIEDLASNTPMISQQSLYGVLQLPKEPVTRQNEWALALARLPYVKYLIQELKKTERQDQSYLNEIRVSLLEAKWANLGSRIDHPEIARIFKQQMDQVVEMMN